MPAGYSTGKYSSVVLFVELGYERRPSPRIKKKKKKLM